MTTDYPLFSGSLEMAPAPMAGRRRFFYRCIDCLTVVATETKAPENYVESRGLVPAVVCDACNGSIEYMGVTAGAAIQKIVGYRSPCDDRCTNARGPECECPCGGANHGSGVVVPIFETNSIPRLGVPKSAGARGEYFRSLCASFETAWGASFGSLQRRRAAGEYLGAEWSRYLAGRKIWDSYIHARGLRSFVKRNKDIEKLILGVN